MPLKHIVPIPLLGMRSQIPGQNVWGKMLGGCPWTVRTLLRWQYFGHDEAFVFIQFFQAGLNLLIRKQFRADLEVGPVLVGNVNVSRAEFGRFYGPKGFPVRHHSEHPWLVENDGIILWRILGHEPEHVLANRVKGPFGHAKGPG